MRVTVDDTPYHHRDVFRSLRRLGDDREYASRGLRSGRRSDDAEDLRSALVRRREDQFGGAATGYTRFFFGVCVTRVFGVEAARVFLVLFGDCQRSVRGGADAES